MTGSLVHIGEQHAGMWMTSVGSGVRPATSRLLSPRQERVARRLHEQVAPGQAVFFRDACDLLAEGPVRPSVTHLIAHLLREVESAVRSVLEPANAAAGVEKDKHRVRIRAVLDELGISHQDWVAELWLGLAGEGNQHGLAARAHRPGLESPRPVNEEFLDFVDKMEQVLDVVLEQFETNYLEIFEKLDSLLATVAPAPAHASALRQNFPRNQAVAHYFFSRASAAWIGPLAAENFFTAPPPALVDEDGPTVQFPPWPESQYLVRIAAEAPQAVAAAVLAMPDTDNSRVSHDMIQIAMAVSPEVAAGMIPKVVDGLDSSFGVLIPQAAGELLVHLCDGGHVDQALDLAVALLRQLPAGDGWQPGGDAYGYGVILREHVPALVTAAGAPALELLSRSLDEVLRADAERRDSQPGEDGSPLWRPNIDGGESRPESDLRDGLVDAVRDAAASIVRSGQGGGADVVKKLESHGWLIFRRVALNLLAQHAGEARDLVAARLTDAAVSTEWGLEREYLLLARNGAACLDAAQLRRFLTLVDNGPAIRRAAAPAASDPEAAEPLERDRVARWQRNRLAAVQRVLPPEWDARYQALVTEYGEAPDPAAPFPGPFAVRSFESPVTAGELAAMPTESLVEFLRTWQPPDNGWPVLSPASLRGALSAAVQGDAARRSADADSFIGLPADYVGAVINGLWQASANGAALNWDGVLRLAAWINQQAEGELAGGGISALPRQWREPRMDMLRLLMAGLSPEPSPISADHDEQVWSIISDSCADPDPTTAREAERPPDEHGGYLSLARGAARAQAIRAAISYGLRLCRRSPDTDRSQVRALLEQHLDGQLDPSCAVRSIYGELFPLLESMDPDWAARHVESVFPMDQGQQILLDAAWDAYLTGGQLTENTWTLLAGTYTVMVERMNPATQDRAKSFLAGQLGAHLINRLWHGRLDAESPDGLLRRFYARASPEVATNLMRSISASLRNLETPAPGLMTRLASFWEFRVAAVKSGADSGELAEFGRWFASGHFDPAWSLRQLLTTLTLTGSINAEDAVLSRLADLAAEQIQPCLAALERLVSAVLDPWRFTRSRDDIRRILAVGATGDPTAVQTTRKVISLLLRDHGIDLRDILRNVISA